MTKHTAKKELVRRISQGRISEDDALSWMVLLHTHQIQLQPGAVNGASDESNVEGFTLAAETQRGAAEIIASLWPDQSDQRANYYYWYWQYNTQTPYEVLEEVPAERLSRIVELKQALEGQPQVAAVIVED